MSKTENSRYLITLVAGISAVILLLTSVFTVAAVNTATPDETQTGTKGQISKGEITLSNGDVLVGENVDGNLTVDVLKAFDVFVDQNGKVSKIKIAKGTVEDVLKRAGIELSGNQIVMPGMLETVSDGLAVRITEGVKLTIADRGETKEQTVPKGTVANALEYLGYNLSDDDILNCSRSAQVQENMQIKIQRVTYHVENTVEKVEYKTEEKYTSDLPEGETKVQSEGKNGKKEVVSLYKYIDGEKVSREVKKETILEKPENRVILKGEPKTEPAFAVKSTGANTFTDANGNTVAYSMVLTGSGTAYTAPAGAYTATGVLAYQGGVAVNPNVIPYGSKLYIASTDGSHVYGYATAVDTGGALMDGSAVVDLFYPTYDQCVNFGRRDVNVYVLS